MFTISQIICSLGLLEENIDSIIIGIICFIIMKILNMPYYVLMLLLVLQMLFLYSIIGAIPSALLVFLAKPSDLIPFLIFILILQQFDGNILPRIIGNSIGLPAFGFSFLYSLVADCSVSLVCFLVFSTFALIYARSVNILRTNLKANIFQQKHQLIVVMLKILYC